MPSGSLSQAKWPVGIGIDHARHAGQHLAGPKNRNEFRAATVPKHPQPAIEQPFAVALGEDPGV